METLTTASVGLIETIDCNGKLRHYCQIVTEDSNEFIEVEFAKLASLSMAFNIDCAFMSWDTITSIAGES